MLTRLSKSHSGHWLVLVLVCGSLVTAQQPGPQSTKSINYGFVSPNTRDDLKLDDAINGMNSTEELRLLRKAVTLGCVVRSRIRAVRALGSWSDGAEHSILLRVNTDESTIRYLMSRLGREANQKAVIYFHPERGGKARVYVVHPARRFRAFATLGRILDGAGIPFRTLVPGNKETIVYVVDTESSLVDKVKTAARRLQAYFTSQTGNASFIGDDSVREKGQNVFAQEIKEYESKHPGLPPPCEAN